MGATLATSLKPQMRVGKRDVEETLQRRKGRLPWAAKTSGQAAGHAVGGRFQVFRLLVLLPSSQGEGLSLF